MVQMIPTMRMLLTLSTVLMLMEIKFASLVAKIRSMSICFPLSGCGYTVHSLVFFAQMSSRVRLQLSSCVHNFTYVLVTTYANTSQFENGEENDVAVRNV